MSTEQQSRTTQTEKSILITQANEFTGFKLNSLIKQCPPLDTNSVYCNLLQCSHFYKTSVAAWYDDELIGFISGYIKPEQQDCYFLWQVAVHPAMRGQNLASKMLEFLFKQTHLSHVQFLETSITEDNQASWRLFLTFAQKHQLATEKSVLFDKQRHFNGQHETEHLLRIGPFQA